MSDFIEIARVDELPAGRIKLCLVGERKIALYHTPKGFFASDNSCPHRGGPLAEGDLMGNEVVCPWHLWGFDVVSGCNTGNADMQLVTHQVRVEGDAVLVRLSAPAAGDGDLA